MVHFFHDRHVPSEYHKDKDGTSSVRSFTANDQRPKRGKGFVNRPAQKARSHVVGAK